MEIYFPAYYEKFRCIAGACPDSCCKEWAVDVDDASAAFYRQLPGELGKRLQEVLIDTDDGTIMQIENGRCPMWQQDGLCRIQAELGHDALCKTCREFPRLQHDYGNFMELGLELSCPEAARLILSGESKDIFVKNVPGGEQPEYDMQIMQILQESRQQAFKLLDSEQYDLPKKLAILLLYGHAVQGQIDGGKAPVFNADSCLATAQKCAAKGDMDSIYSFFRALEILTPQWKKYLDSAPTLPVWSAQLTELARYLIARYWLQTIADYDLVCRVKFVIVACLLVSTLNGDPIQTAQLFSKEIENDPDNLEAIFSGAYNSTALTDTNLLGLLLH